MVSEHGHWTKLRRVLIVPHRDFPGSIVLSAVQQHSSTNLGDLINQRWVPRKYFDNVHPRPLFYSGS